jgi:pimeloyl-ACP methyl ester carboxylesterase
MPLDIITPQISQSIYWEWKSWQVHYVQAGTVGPNLVLIHGFGASTDHWRKNIEVLSAHYRVWAVDLLGFGRSQKPKITYGADLWRDQLRDFCAQVVQETVFIAGNSLGGYISLCFAVDCPEWTQGLILLNCAGPFSEGPAVVRPTWQTLMATSLKMYLRCQG